ncbi:MAG: hypothetical protein IPK67_15405 [Planctomycetes bacterium]|nr:hypothetical protein [Planctomycetota bacterium]
MESPARFRCPLPAIALLGIASRSLGQDGVPLVRDGLGGSDTVRGTAAAHFNGADSIGTVETTTLASGRLLRSTNRGDWTPATEAGFGKGVITGLPEVAGTVSGPAVHFDTGAQLWAWREEFGLRTGFCPAAPNRSGNQAMLRAEGDGRLSGVGVRLDVRGSPPNTAVPFFHGAPPPQSPLGAGILCVGGPQHRIPGSMRTDADGRASRFVACDEPSAGELFPRGTGVACQAWFRAPGPGRSSLSDALAIVHRP